MFITNEFIFYLGNLSGSKWVLTDKDTITDIKRNKNIWCIDKNFISRRTSHFLSE